MTTATGTELRCATCQQVVLVTGVGEVLPGEQIAAAVARHRAQVHGEGAVPQQRPEAPVA